MATNTIERPFIAQLISCFSNFTYLYTRKEICVLNTEYIIDQALNWIVQFCRSDSQSIRVHVNFGQGALALYLLLSHMR